MNYVTPIVNIANFLSGVSFKFARTNNHPQAIVFNKARDFSFRDCTMESIKYFNTDVCFRLRCAQIAAETVVPTIQMALDEANDSGDAFTTFDTLEEALTHSGLGELYLAPAQAIRDHVQRYARNGKVVFTSQVVGYDGRDSLGFIFETEDKVVVLQMKR